jgi:hypothetical protein
VSGTSASFAAQASEPSSAQDQVSAFGEFSAAGIEAAIALDLFVATASFGVSIAEVSAANDTEDAASAGALIPAKDYVAYGSKANRTGMIPPHTTHFQTRSSFSSGLTSAPSRTGTAPKER